jgi:hypothetical protein
MSRASVLARGRIAAEAGMVDTCLIRRQTGSTTNPTTGVNTPTFTQIYPALPAVAGACKLQESSGLPRDANPTPIAPVLMVYRQLHLPVASSPGILAGDQVTVVTCVNDPAMVGKVLVIRSERGKSYGTARRLDVEEETS